MSLTSKHFLLRILLLIFLLGGSVQLFIWVIDPYGVSPIQIDVVGVNHDKPKRVNIDRQIKPFEVWRYRPSTVFMGTSRIHQSLVPADLSGTTFAPAYNAAIPASSLAENLSHISQFIETNENLETIVLGLFIYNFLRPQIFDQGQERGYLEMLEQVVPLNLSTSALWDSLVTLRFNLRGKLIGTHIHRDGYDVRAIGYPWASDFDRQMYVNSIMQAHLSIPDMIVQPTAIEAMERIAELCREKDVRLILVIAPTYPWDDYRLYSLGYWPLLQEWYRLMAEYPDVFDFAKFNEYTVEEAGTDMQYWYDPLHFSKNMGKLMLQAMGTGIGVGEVVGVDQMGPDFYSMLNVDNVDRVLAEKLQGLNKWASENPEFVELFDSEKARTGNDYQSRIQR
jgi:hypothetical protein